MRQRKEDVPPLRRAKAAKANESRGERIATLFWRGRGVSGVYEVYDRQLSGKKRDQRKRVCRCGGGREVDRARALRAAVKVEEAENLEPDLRGGRCRSSKDRRRSESEGDGRRGPQEILQARAKP